jgi:hypothetical protein
MLEGIVALMLVAGGVYGGLWWARRRGGGTGLSGTANAAIVGLQGDPAVVEILRQPPATPVSKTVPVVTTETREAVARDPRTEQSLARLLSALEGWTPRSRTYEDEKGFENSMRRCLGDRNISRAGDYEVKRPMTLALKRGRPRKLTPDFIFWGKLSVEVKGHMTRSADADRALGQLYRYLLAWKHVGPSILIVCGECDAHLQDFIIGHVEMLRAGPFNMPVTVFFASHQHVRDVPLIANA